MSVERPLDEMILNPIQKSKYFSKEADIVLLCLTHEHVYCHWTKIKHAIRRDGRVRFDHLLMSRSDVELQRRVDILVKTIEKENEQAANNLANGGQPHESGMKGGKNKKSSAKMINSDQSMSLDHHDDKDILMQQEVDEFERGHQGNHQEVEMDYDMNSDNSDDSEGKIRIGQEGSSAEPGD